MAADSSRRSERLPAVSDLRDEGSDEGILCVWISRVAPARPDWPHCSRCVGCPDEISEQLRPSSLVTGPFRVDGAAPGQLLAWCAKDGCGKAAGQPLREVGGGPAALGDEEAVEVGVHEGPAQVGGVLLGDAGGETV